MKGVRVDGEGHLFLKLENALSIILKCLNFI